MDASTLDSQEMSLDASIDSRLGRVIGSNNEGGGGSGRNADNHDHNNIVNNALFDLLVDSIECSSTHYYIIL